MQFPDATQLIATTVSGRQKLLKPQLSAGIELNHLGDPKASLDDVMKESARFIGICYGHKCDPSDTMSSSQSATKYGYHALGERGPVSFRN